MQGSTARAVGRQSSNQAIMDLPVPTTMEIGSAMKAAPATSLRPMHTSTVVVASGVAAIHPTAKFLVSVECRPLPVATSVGAASAI
jgi:hypothetical protein